MGPFNIIPHLRMKLCALRTRSHWRCSSLFARGHQRARFAHLVYYLPAPTGFALDVFLPNAGVVLPPPPVTILSARSDLLSCRQSAFLSFHTSSQTSPISSTYTCKCPAKFEVHVDTHAQNRACSAGGGSLKVRNEEMEKWEMRKWENGKKVVYIAFHSAKGC